MFTFTLSLRHWIVALLMFGLCFPYTTYAQESAGAGLAPTNIDPGRIVDPGEQLQEVIRVTNLSDREETYYLSVRDISGVRDNGTPIYAKENTEQTGFELSEWITLEQGELTLASGEERAVGVIVDIPENATPGSHFGGIFVSAVPPELNTVGAGVGFEVANIVHIRIAGDVVESAQIRTFATDQLFYSTPKVEFSARVENKGNVLVRPYGPLEIYNMLGNRVYSETFNENLGGVFPGTIRDFKFMWSDNDSLRFGRYEARLSLVYGQEGVGQSTMSSETSFWVLPLEIIKPAAITLGVLLLCVYIFIRLYVRRKMYTVTRGRRIVRRPARRGTSTFLIVSVVMLSVTAVFLLILLLLFA